MTDLQLEIMRLGASKELNFGCIVEAKFNSGDVGYYTICELGDDIYGVIQTGINKGFERVYLESKSILDPNYIIIGHPITRGRLCYLRQTDKSGDTVVNGVKQKMEKWINLCWNFENNLSLYNKTILEWDEKTLLLVRDFLLSIQ